jgi:hypothetical protein
VGDVINHGGKLIGVDEDADISFSAIRVAKIPVRALTAGEKDTGFDLPVRGIVLDVFCRVKTAEVTDTTKTIDIGLLSSETGGDIDGFCDGLSTAAVAVVDGALAVTDGVNTNFFTAAPTQGVLLRDGLLGADAAATPGVLTRRPHVLNGTARSLVYQLGSAHTELVADIFVVYVDLDEFAAEI